MPRPSAQPKTPSSLPASASAKDLVVYENDADLRLEVMTDGETVWLTQAQMCRLFGRERSVITKHIRNVFKEGELEEKAVCAKFAHTTPHGAMPGRTQLSESTLYNLDVVISVGYRVKSVQGVRFRQWATHILREMLLQTRRNQAHRCARAPHGRDRNRRWTAQAGDGLPRAATVRASARSAPP